jgi:hypothetical protein
MDLESTLIRAEALFRRFQRTVEAIDRKDNFRTSTNVRHRRPGLGLPNGSTDSTNVIENPNVTSSISPPATALTSASTTGTDRSPSPSTPSRGKQPEPGDASGDNVETRVITPELRALLSRETPKLEKGEVKQHGGGVGT